MYDEPHATSTRSDVADEDGTNSGSDANSDEDLTTRRDGTASTCGDDEPPPDCESSDDDAEAIDDDRERFEYRLERLRLWRTAVTLAIAIARLIRSL